jgi:hypothetical protein
MGMIRGVWSYRGFILGSVKREFQSKYLNSLLGVAWTVIQPLSKVHAGDTYIFKIKFSANLGPGTYSVQTALVSSDTHLENNYEWRDLALVFNVVNVSRTHFAGSSWIEPEIKVVT